MIMILIQNCHFRMRKNQISHLYGGKSRTTFSADDTVSPTQKCNRESSSPDNSQNEKNQTDDDISFRHLQDAQETTDGPHEEMKSQSSSIPVKYRKSSRICEVAPLPQVQCRIFNQEGTKLPVKQNAREIVGYSAIDKTSTGLDKVPHTKSENFVRSYSFACANIKGFLKKSGKLSSKGSCQNTTLLIYGCLYAEHAAKFLLLLGLSAFSGVSSATLPLVCRRGYYLHTPRIGPDFCLPCQDGQTYIPVDLHSYRQCLNCTKIVDPVTEVLGKECNKYRDSEILCQPGFYRRSAPNSEETDKCAACSQCEVITLPCEGNHDTVCCGLNYDAVLIKDGVYVCKERPIRCGRGEFLKTSTEQCTSCPANTYRPETDHNETKCLSCLDTGQDSIINREVVRACNTTHPALFECNPGFYRNVSREAWQLSEEDCRPCQTCQFLGRNCTRIQDTVCCPSPDMVVSDSPLGSTCLKHENHLSENKTIDSTLRPIDDEETCGEAEYLSYNMDNTKGNSRSRYCVKCPLGTYNPAVNHTWTTCVNLSDWTYQKLPDSLSRQQNTNDDHLHHIVANNLRRKEPDRR